MRLQRFLALALACSPCLAQQAPRATTVQLPKGVS